MQLRGMGGPNMKKKMIITMLCGLAAFLSFCACTKQKEETEPVPMEGGRKVEYIEGLEEKIESKDIIAFSYSAPEYNVKCTKEGDKLHIISDGGYSDERDGSYFRLDYESDDLTFLNTLQEIAEKYELSKDNGYTCEVGGLPGGLGDTISVKYESGESIYKSSNQALTISEEAAAQIYEAFHQYAVKNGYDFNSEGSNVVLYNDADKEYLQGTWVGKHFGREFKAEFSGDRVKIYCDGKLTDDCGYSIYEGCVTTDELKDGVTEAKDEHDYEEFSEISCFRKCNDVSITAYFMKGSYSTDSLYKQE